MTLNPDLDSSWIGSGGEAICKQELDNYELPGGRYFYHYESATGLEVEVTMRLAGNFCVKLTDTDCERVVGIKMFPAKQRNEAIAYAKSCVGM